MIDKEDWAEEAYSALRYFANKSNRFMWDPWTVEEIRLRATRSGRVIQPPELRWWGPVVQRALREKIIIRKGWGTAKSSNRSPKRRYIGSKWA